ncbi:MAG: AlpA family phage regulatory protein [Rhodopseudomonas palustris]|uniref:AlpA family phage regulatory protein n=1 Tax=Rhodopseudomonas palustris TaxID=1076 RepID=A0A933RVC6_RHOPL|nr:AlpA family phage regulatory protein [Rhodopseudomonas palustris]
MDAANKRARKVLVAAPIALSIPATAESIGLGRSTLYQLIKDGAGPRVTKIKRRSVVLVRDRDAWLAGFSNAAAA